MSDAFLTEHDVHFVRNADFVCDARLRRVIGTLRITAKRSFAASHLRSKELKLKKESIISNQIGRSETSIGANIHEAQYAQGKKDFISKLEIALKEASETGYWLELLYKTEYIDENEYRNLLTKCKSLRAMLVASCKTAKENQ